MTCIKRWRKTIWCSSKENSSNKSPTRCNNFPVYYPDVYLQLNVFRAFSRPSSGAQWLQWQPLVLPSYHGDSRAVFVVRPAGPTKVKPEAATAVIELLMMGEKTPETCWAVNKRQDNKLENCCIWLVIYLNCTTMHGLTNLKKGNSLEMTRVQQCVAPATVVLLFRRRPTWHCDVYCTGRGVRNH